MWFSCQTEKWKKEHALGSHCSNAMTFYGGELVFSLWESKKSTNWSTKQNPENKLRKSCEIKFIFFSSFSSSYTFQMAEYWHRKVFHGIGISNAIETSKQCHIIINIKNMQQWHQR